MTKAVKNRVEQLDAIHKEALAEYVGVLANNRVGTNQIAVRIGSSGGRFAIRGTNVIDVLESLYAGEPSVQSIRQNNQILASTRDGQLYVSAKVFDASSRQIVEIVDNEWKVAEPPLTWDRNYTTNALEVCDDKGDVVFQVVLRGHEISFQAKLFGSDGKSVAFVEPTPSRFQQVFVDPVSTLKIQPLFVYPSRRHLGELSTQNRLPVALPALRLLLCGRELVKFEKGEAMNILLVLPPGNTPVMLLLTNASATTFTNVQIELKTTGKFALPDSADGSSLVNSDIIAFHIDIGSIGGKLWA